MTVSVDRCSAETSGYGTWNDEKGRPPETGVDAVCAALRAISRPVFAVDLNGCTGVAHHGEARLFPSGTGEEKGGFRLLGYAPPLLPENFGDPYFKQMIGIRYAYVAGAMANGITSVRMVEAAARAGMVGFFGAAGLAPADVEKAIDQLQKSLGDLPFGMNLIHSSGDPLLEEAIVDLYLRKKVRLISASAFMRLTPYIVRYRLAGIHRDGSGRIVIPNRIVAKVSRVEVAARFFSPPPDKLVAQLLEQGKITAEEAALAPQIPMADALSAEADSGGHTDNRPALGLLPTMTALRDEMCRTYQYDRPIPVGLGGGIATPESAAAAFAMGAAYVLTGSVNQACVEAGVSDMVRQMLVEAGQADVTMAPAADMFEMGGKVQVLKRGTMFAMRASKLYELYVRYSRFDDIPAKDREMVEQTLLRRSFDQEWEETKRFFQARDPRQIERAEKDPRHKMALVFRSYLGRSSRWGVTGEADRKVDFQIWCGPAIGAFNEWVRGTFLEKMENRTLVTVAMNLLFGAAVVTRAVWLGVQGVELPVEARRCSPLPTAEI
ncbi:MAG: PfaD family polyunsaturated fatty acid/polyketide biosynthesis protein, partial [Thermodesulfobacteriota bacterium]